ncbi:MAG: hypothetical protein ACJ0A6_05185 [Dehalococcoidia bacterium]
MVTKYLFIVLTGSILFIFIACNSSNSTNIDATVEARVQKYLNELSKVDSTNFASKQNKNINIDATVEAKVAKLLAQIPTPTPIIITRNAKPTKKEIIIERVEVPVEVIKEVKVPVEVIKEVEVPVEVIKEVEVIVEVIKEVEVIVEVIKEIIITPTPVPTPTAIPVPTPAPIIDHGGGRILTNEIYISTIDYPGDIDEWVFDSTIRDNVTISMDLISSDNGLNPYLELITPSGKLEASDDDSAGGVNAIINSAILTENGRYTIRAQGYSESTTGTYKILLNIVMVD